MYLHQYDEKKKELDGFTEMVALHAVKLMGVFTENVTSQSHQFQPAIQVFYNDVYVARVVEGCNAISVMILFAAFIFAFSGRLHKTILYIVFGIILLHVLNCIRIALLCFSLFHYKQYGSFLHGTIFPLFIYGAVFVLWILWVTKYSGYAKVSNDK